MTTFLQLLLNGLTIGSVYALVGVGLSLVWATLRSLNFAHGDLYMLGAFASLGVGTVVAGLASSWNFWVVLPLMLLAGMVVAGIVSVAIERIIFRPLRAAPAVIPILATIGVSIVLQDGMLLRFGARPHSFPLDVPRVAFVVGGVNVNIHQLGIIVLTLVLILGLAAYLMKTRRGRGMRAIAWDEDAARLMGVNTSSLIALSFGIAGAFAGLAGVFTSYYFGVTTFFMGFIIVVKGFIAAVFGGFGNIRGALLGGWLLGILEALAAGYIGGRWRDVAAFALLMAVLLMKPTGILGEKLPTKV